jgi:hypothetical protein
MEIVQWNRFVLCGRTDELTKIIVAFGNFANAPKMYFYQLSCMDGDLGVSLQGKNIFRG